MILAKPEMVRCVRESETKAPNSTMELRWDDCEPAVAENVWYLPDGVIIRGSAPKRFGVSVRRTGRNVYGLRVRWDALDLEWESLNSRQILASSLGIILHALGIEIANLLDQPIDHRHDVAA